MKVCHCARLVVLTCLFVVSAGAEVLNGQFALQGQTPQTNGYLKVTDVPGHPLRKTLDFWDTDPGKPQPIRDYQVEMTKKLHVIIVSSDFKTFLHEHPVMENNGHLRLTQDFPAPGSYLIYADGLPKQLNHQVFRFQFNVDGGTPAAPVVQPTGKGVQIGPYEVDLSTLRLHSGMMSMVDVAILKNGKPATDLHPYLGSPAHAVFLNAKDLSYVHVHPMGMDQMMKMDMNGNMNMPDMPEDGPSPADMMLHIALREPGIYKLWLQFRGGTQLYVAQFVITAS